MQLLLLRAEVIHDKNVSFRESTFVRYCKTFATARLSTTGSNAMKKIYSINLLYAGSERSDWLKNFE